MFKLNNILRFSHFLLFLLVLNAEECLSDNQDEGKIILTRYIQQERFKEAREASRVRNLTRFEVLSYAGYFEVDQEAKCQSKLFFWFIPAAYGWEDAPVILWHGGGPGSSGLTGAFVDHGPILIDDDGQPQLRSYAWTFTRSMIFVDSPLGVGFSEHDDREECLVKSSDKAGRHVYEALQQFFQVFKEFQKNDFYIFTGSYGGKFAPAVALEIHRGNEDKTKEFIRLKGLCIASGFTDPINQIDYGDFYHGIGLIDDFQWNFFKMQEAQAKDCIRRGNYVCAFETIEPLIIGIDGVASRLLNLTGITYPYNLGQNLKTIPKAMRNHVPFLNKLDVRLALHAGKFKKYSASSSPVYYNFLAEIYQSMKTSVEKLLDADSPSGRYLYKLLIISNQNDLVVPHTTIRNYLNALNWKGARKYQMMGARPWTLPGDKEHGVPVAGYSKSVDNLTYLFLRNTGHIWIMEQPKIAFEVMEKFTRAGEQEFC